MSKSPWVVDLPKVLRRAKAFWNSGLLVISIFTFFQYQIIPFLSAYRSVVA